MRKEMGMIEGGSKEGVKREQEGGENDVLVVKDLIWGVDDS